jgi:hypothetical protein
MAERASLFNNIKYSEGGLSRGGRERLQGSVCEG